jgi:uncharacterized membrane-anchored protein YitT (DUF2179 family)
MADTERTQEISFSTNRWKKIIYTIVDRKELILLQRYVHEIDPKAFMTVMDSTETLGEGFRSLKDKIDE